MNFIKGNLYKLKSRGNFFSLGKIWNSYDHPKGSILIYLENLSCEKDLWFSLLKGKTLYSLFHISQTRLNFFEKIEEKEE